MSRAEAAARRILEGPGSTAAGHDQGLDSLYSKGGLEGGRRRFVAAGVAAVVVVATAAVAFVLLGGPGGGSGQAQVSVVTAQPVLTASTVVQAPAVGFDRGVECNDIVATSPVLLVGEFPGYASDVAGWGLASGVADLTKGDASGPVTAEELASTLWRWTCPTGPASALAWVDSVGVVIPAASTRVDNVDVILAVWSMLGGRSLLPSETSAGLPDDADAAVVWGTAEGVVPSERTQEGRVVEPRWVPGRQTSRFRVVELLWRIESRVNPAIVAAPIS